MKLGWIVVVLCLASLPVQTAAQPSSAPDGAVTAAARALFEEGVRLVDAGDFDQAADRFRRSDELHASPVVAYNLATSLAEIGRIVEASEVSRRVVRDAAAPQAIRAAAQSLLDRITPRIGSLTIRVVGDPEGVETRLDGATVPVALIGVARPVDPGQHVVSLARGGEETASTSVEVLPGGAAEVSLSAPPPPPIATVAPVAPAPALPVVAADPGPVVPAAALVLAPVAPEEHHGSVLEEAWFWGVAGAVVVAGIVIAVVLAFTVHSASPVSGNFEPGVVEVGR